MGFDGDHAALLAAAGAAGGQAAGDVLVPFKCLMCRFKEGLYPQKWTEKHMKVCRELQKARQRFEQDRAEQRRKKIAAHTTRRRR